jgi:hypothetical protein
LTSVRQLFEVLTGPDTDAPDTDAPNAPDAPAPETTIMMSQTGGGGAPTSRELEGPVGKGTIPISPAIQNPDDQATTTEDDRQIAEEVHVLDPAVSEQTKRVSVRRIASLTAVV